MGEINERYMNFFRLNSIVLLGHPILGSIHINFCQDDGVPQDVYTSVVIGSNGIGKSYLLRAIAEIFCCLEELKTGERKNVPQYYFKIEFVAQWHKQVFANFREFNVIERGERRYTHFLYSKDGEEVDIKSILLPKRVIAISTTVTDKYVARSTEMYRYKGLRNEKSPSSTGTRTMVRKTVDSLLGSLDAKYGFLDELKELLCHLGLQPKLELSYNIRYKQVFVKENMTSAELMQIFENQKKDERFKRRTELWGTQNYRRIKEIEPWKLDEAAKLLGWLAKNGYGNGRQLLKYDLLKEVERVNSDNEALKALASLDLLSYPTLKVYKNGTDYEYGKSSSGELSLLFQMVGIMSDIEPNSLILIDEPENSSHPNWQMSYIRWLKNIFHLYYNCHFVISTHSHFILTDLEPATSDIVVLEKKGDVIKDVSDGVNTFNWSVDDILYRVFGVCNTRNHAFETDIMTLYKLMSEASDDLVRIRRLTANLSAFELPENDPLTEILNQARKYVEANKTI